jgi:VIT1/CCC1 family predicted Fe2+/Mn2+ transporter
VDEPQRKRVLRFQQDEITGLFLYLRLSERIKNAHNAQVVREMADTEKRHYEFWKNISQVEMRPNQVQIALYLLMTRLLGLTFSIKLLEKGEAAGAKEYADFDAVVPGAAQMGREEDEHERAMAGMIEEDILSYVGSIVLGLNDALVEMTGTLAGLTLAFQSGQLVAVSGLITGIAAALSMAASEFLSLRADDNPKAIRSAFYTGGAYIIAVFLLILPYLLVPQTGAGVFISLGITLVITIAIIFGFNFYLSVAKDLPFRQRFTEMLVISLGVSALSFLVGLVVRNVFRINA